MVTCPNCKKEFEDGTMFCNNCGTKLEPVVTQKHPQQALQAQRAYLMDARGAGAARAF